MMAVSIRDFQRYVLTNFRFVMLDFARLDKSSPDMSPVVCRAWHGVRTCSHCTLEIRDNANMVAVPVGVMAAIQCLEDNGP